nr:hypothetical protein [Fischerella sp. PCC 9605]
MASLPVRYHLHMCALVGACREVDTLIAMTYLECDRTPTQPSKSV